MTVDLQMLRDNLFECLAKIAIAPSSQLQPSQKKTMVHLMKSTFGFNSDQDFNDFYNGHKRDNKLFFEGSLVDALIRRLGYGKKYFLE